MAIRWPFTRAYEVAKLERDATHVCDDAERRFPVDAVRTLAEGLREHLEEAGRRLEQPRMTRANVLAELRGRHREARRRARDRELSELTLAIIRIRAEELDATGAMAAIERFLERWPPLGAPDETRQPEPSEQPRRGGPSEP